MSCPKATVPGKTGFVRSLDGEIPVQRNGVPVWRSQNNPDSTESLPEWGVLYTAYEPGSGVFFLFPIPPAPVYIHSGIPAPHSVSLPVPHGQSPHIC